jgi:hypothetical protein
LLSAHLDKLTVEEQEVLKEYAEMMRKKTLFWGAF